MRKRIDKETIGLVVSAYRDGEPILQISKRLGVSSGHVGPAELAKLGLVEEKYLRHPQAARLEKLREEMRNVVPDMPAFGVG